MVEFMACVGLACLDDEFRSGLKENGEKTVKQYGFRLTRYELAELERMLGNKDTFDNITAVCASIRCRPAAMCRMIPPESGRYSEFREAHQAAIRAYAQAIGEESASFMASGRKKS